MQNFREQFFIAIARNDLETIQQLYENNSITLYETNALAQLPADVALEHSNRKIANWLRRQYGFNLFGKIKLLDKESSDAVQCIREELKYNPDLMVLNENKDSLLHLAVTANDKNLVTFLLSLIDDKYDIEISNLINGNGLDCLEAAFKLNNLDMALHIIRQISHKKIQWDMTRAFSVLATARKMNESGEDELLLECLRQMPFPHGFSEPVLGSLLLKLVKKEDYEVVQIILQKSPNTRNGLVDQLVRQGDFQLIHFVLARFPELRSQPNAAGQYPLEIFAGLDKWKLVWLALDEAVPFNRTSELLVNSIAARSTKGIPDKLFHPVVDKCLSLYMESSFYLILQQSLTSDDQPVFKMICENLSLDGKGASLIEASAKMDWDMVSLLCEGLPVCDASAWYDRLLLQIIATRQMEVSNELLMKCITKLLQVGKPGDIRASQGQNWIHILAQTADFKVMLAFLKYNLDHLKFFFERDSKGFSPLEILINSGRFSMNVEFMQGCLVILKAINNIPSGNNQPRPSFFDTTNSCDYARVRTVVLKSVFAVMEKASERKEKICSDILRELLRGEIDVKLLQNSSDYILQFLAKNGYNKIVLQLSATDRSCTRIPEVKSIDRRQQELLKHEIPVLLFLARRDLGCTLFLYIPQKVLRLICFAAVRGYFAETASARNIEMRSHRGLHPFFESMHDINHINVPGKDAFLQFQAAHRSAHSLLNKGSIESQILMTDLARIASEEPLAFSVRGGIVMRIHKFIHERYESGNLAETTTIALLKKHDYISESELSDIKKQHTKSAIKAMVGKFNKLNNASNASNNLMRDLLEMTKLPKMSPAELYRLAREHTLDYLRAVAVKKSGQIEATKTILLLQTYMDITDIDIADICRNYKSGTPLEEIQVFENDDDFDFCLMR